MAIFILQIHIIFFISLSLVSGGLLPNKYKKDYSESNAESLKLLVVGGIDNSGMFLVDVEFINPFSSSNSCEKKPDYPINPSNPYPKAYDNCGSGYMFTGGVYRNDTYELVNNEWVDRGRLAYERYRATCGTLSNGSFIVVGGIDSNGENYMAYKSHEIKADSDSPFETLQDLPEEMDAHCMAKINDTHFFIAGSSFTENTAYLIDTQENDFIYTKLPLMNEYRYGAACGSWIDEESGDQLLIVAGGNYDAADTSEIFSMKKYEWVNGPYLPYKVEGGGYFSDQQNPLIMVGGMNGFLKESSLMAYQKETDSFEILPAKLKIGRWRLAATGVYDNEDC